MKKILLFFLVIIILIFAYSQYKEYQRFHPENANIQPSDSIDVHYHNQETVYQYYNALADANNYMQMQWSANGIDIRSPENDDEETVLAVTEYGKKVAKLNYYKTILEESKTLKSSGLSNEDVKLIETKGVSVSDFNKAEAKAKYNKQILELMPTKALYTGEKSAFVFEVQKLLLKHGFTIPLDGVYQMQTIESLKVFEEKNNLFPDGKIDKITLLALLN